MTNQKSTLDHYAELGVSSQKEDVHEAFKDFDAGLFPGSFCKIVPDIAGDKDYCMIMHADGPGTKISLAYALWKETGDMSGFVSAPIDAIVMNIDDLLCVGCVGPILLSQTINRNKFLISKEVLARIAEGTQSFISKMSKYGIAILHTGGETADVGDLVRTIVMDITVVARMKRKDVVPTRIQPGDIIVGLSSFGQCEYEDEYNSGIGSNGLTNARHDIFAHYLAESYPELFDPLIADIAYSGKMNLRDEIEAGSKMYGAAKLVLSPTRTYAPVIKAILTNADEGQISREAISAIIHCSGGGQTKCLKFTNGTHIIKDNLFEIPPLFNTIYKAGKVSAREMYKNFNMGHRMEIYCRDENTADAVRQISNCFGVEARIIGRCVESNGGAMLTIKSELGEFEYK